MEESLTFYDILEPYLKFCNKIIAEYPKTFRNISTSRRNSSLSSLSRSTYFPLDALYVMLYFGTQISEPKCPAVPNRKLLWRELYHALFAPIDVLGSKRYVAKGIVGRAEKPRLHL